jgi:purine-nucleoside phosphorylase
MVIEGVMMHSECRYDAPAANEAAEFLDSYFESPPQTAIITGTGLGSAVADLQTDHVIDYQAIPSFPVSTAIAHPGRLMIGTLAGHCVVAMQGRFHLYEGYSPKMVTFPIRVFQAMGIKTLVVINASGGIDPRLRAGDIMIIGDHINLTGRNPLTGPNDDSWGPRFPDMTKAYSRQLCDSAFDVAKKLNIPIHKGVYAGLTGPSLETPAEIRYLRTIGADAVGFSTVMETIAAVHAGIEVLGFAAITNACDPDRPVPADVSEIISVAESIAPRITDIITHVIKQLSSETS